MFMINFFYVYDLLINFIFKFMYPCIPISYINLHHIFKYLLIIVTIYDDLFYFIQVEYVC